MKDLRRHTQDLSHFKREITDALGQEITIRKGGEKNRAYLQNEREKSRKFLQCDFHGPWGPMGFC